MKSPLGAAIAARRKPQEMPSESEAPAMAAESMGEEAGESKVAQMLAALAPEEKAELFQLLQSEMTEQGENEETGEQGSEQMTDAAGVLKSTPGEQAELAESEEMPDEGGGNSFLKFARKNIANLTKQGKLK
jgi:hypothetical protein